MNARSQVSAAFPAPKKDNPRVPQKRLLRQRLLIVLLALSIVFLVVAYESNSAAAAFGAFISVVGALTLLALAPRRARFNPESCMNAHLLMGSIAQRLGLPTTSLRFRERADSLEISLTDKRTGIKVAELARVEFPRTGPSARQDSYSIDRVAVSPNLAAAVEPILALAGYSYRSSGYQGFAIYTRDSHPEAAEALPATRKSEWLGQPIGSSLDVCTALVTSALMSVQVASEQLTEVAMAWRKDLNFLQMEALYMILFSARLALSIKTHDDKALEFDLLKQFDTLVTNFCADKRGLRATLTQRTDRYMIALVPDSTLPSSIAKEYSSICGGEDESAIRIASALVVLMVNNAGELIDTFRNSQASCRQVPA